MKFLKEGTIKKEEKGIKVEFKQVTSSEQASLIVLSQDKTITGRTKLTEIILKNYILNLEIENKKYDPVYVAENADLSDPSTVDTFYFIGSMFMNSIILSPKTKKKSKGPVKRTKRGKSARAARGV